MIGNKHKATFILGAVSLAFFSCYPFRYTFIGGLFTSGFGAAMIGGLADWFAVTALFRRPLGIPFRTGIIPRNREKILQALVHIVENQLLVKENIKSKLNECDIASAVVNIMVERGGKQVVKRILYAFISEILVQVKPRELGKIVNDIIKKSVEEIKMSFYLFAGIEWLIKNNDADKIINFTLKQCIILAEHKQLNILLVKCFIATQQRYEQGMTRRKIFNQLLQLSPEEVGRMGQEFLINHLTDMQDEEHPLRKKFKAWSLSWLIEKKTDLAFQQKIDKWIGNLLNQMNLAQYATSYISEFCAGALADQRQRVKWLEMLTRQIDKKVAIFAENEHARDQFNEVLRKLFSNWIDGYHGEIGKMVMESLNQFTDGMLVEFIESKVGNDLQMIRINGSVVGGLVGVVLYVMTFWL